MIVGSRWLLALPWFPDDCVQPVSWVPSSTCVREKPEGFSFCRTQVDEGLLLG